MTSTALAISAEGRGLQAALRDQLGEAMRGVLPTNVRPERMILSIVQCGERNPTLYECTPDSLQLAALSMATMNLECDGFSGQGYLLPFRDKRRNRRIVQPVIGYRGYNTLAGRNGIIITGGIVRDGDRFEYEFGTSPYLRHVPTMHPRKRQIIASWAIASRPGWAPIPVVLSIEELLAIKARAPGSKKSDSPWNDPEIGFPAMCEKSAKRRLARSVPHGWIPIGDALESCWDTGRPASVHMEEGAPIVTLDTEFAGEVMAEKPEGATLEGELDQPWIVIVPREDADPARRAHNGPTAWAADFEQLLRRCHARTPELLEGFWKANDDGLWRLGETDPEKREQVQSVYDDLIARAS